MNSSPSQILYFVTIALNVTGLVFSLAFVLMNAFSSRTDLPTRNDAILKTVRTSMYMSILSALLSCLLVRNAGEVSGAIRAAGALYSAIAVSWLCVLLLCGLMILYVFVFRPTIRTTLLLKSIRKLFSTAVLGAVLGLILAWLLG